LTLVTLASTLAYLGLAIVGAGEFVAFFSQRVLTVICDRDLRNGHHFALR
jgi:hypothetical protein